MNGESPVTRIDHLPPLPDRGLDTHKGTFGRVLIIGGSRGMSGAAVLAGQGALRGGAGLVFLAVPESIQNVVSSLEASYLSIALPEDDQGRVSSAAAGKLDELVQANTAAAIGPGWGRSDDLGRLAVQLYSTAERPMVVDADAINALAQLSGGLPEATAPRILTPHPGEFARLLSSDTADVQTHREEYAVRYAQTHGVVLLLKGHHTVITDGQRIAVNSTGNNGMSTGGSGDVLTGLITALVAQGMPAFEAAQLGAHLHGLAGDLAADALSEPGMIASDLPSFLPQAWKRMNG